MIGWLAFLWVTPQSARANGCTHYARSFGIIPGFYGEEGDDAIWLSRSPILDPLEYLLAVIWTTMRRLRGEDPDFMFEIRGEIK